MFSIKCDEENCLCLRNLGTLHFSHFPVLLSWVFYIFRSTLTTPYPKFWLREVTKFKSLPYGEEAGKAGTEAEPAASGTTHPDQSPSRPRQAPAPNQLREAPAEGPAPCAHALVGVFAGCLEGPVITRGDKYVGSSLAA